MVGWLVDIVVGMKELVLPKLIAKILMLVVTKKAVIAVAGRPTIVGFVAIIASRFVLKPVGKLVEKLTGLAIAIGIEKIETRPILAIGDTIEESLVGSMVIVVVDIVTEQMVVDIVTEQMVVDIDWLAISRLIIAVVIHEHTEWKAVAVVDIIEMLTVVPKPIVLEHSSESIKIEKEPIVSKLTTSRFVEIEMVITTIELITIVGIENELIISRFIGLVAIVIKVELIAIITKFIGILVGSLGVIVPRPIVIEQFRLVGIVVEKVLGIVTEKQLAVVRHIISRSIAIEKQKLAIKQSIDFELAIAITKMQLATKTRSMMARLIVTNSKSFELNLPTLKQMAIIIMNVELKPMIVDMKAAEIIAIIIITVIKKINGTIVRPIPALELAMIAELLMLIPILVHPTRRLVDAMIVALLLALILETNWKLAAPIVNRILHLRRLALQRLITDAMTMKLTLARIPVGIAEMLELVPILVRHRQQQASAKIAVVQFADEQSITIKFAATIAVEKIFIAKLIAVTVRLTTVIEFSAVIENLLIVPRRAQPIKLLACAIDKRLINMMALNKSLALIPRLVLNSIAADIDLICLRTSLKTQYFALHAFRVLILFPTKQGVISILLNAFYVLFYISLYLI